MYDLEQLFRKCEYTTTAMTYDWFTVLIWFYSIDRAHTPRLSLAICLFDQQPMKIIWSTSNWEEFVNTRWTAFIWHFCFPNVLNRVFIIATQFHINDLIFQTQDGIYLSSLLWQHHNIASSTATEPLLHQVTPTVSSTWRAQLAAQAVSLWRRLHWQT